MIKEHYIFRLGLDEGEPACGRVPCTWCLCLWWRWFVWDVLSEYAEWVAAVHFVDKTHGHMYANDKIQEMAIRLLHPALPFKKIMADPTFFNQFPVFPYWLGFYPSALNIFKNSASTAFWGKEPQRHSILYVKKMFLLLNGFPLILGFSIEGKYISSIYPKVSPPPPHPQQISLYVLKVSHFLQLQCVET